MRVFFLPLALLGVLGLSSCGLLRSATQLPIRTLQSVGRAVGLGLEQSEVEGGEASKAKVGFEIEAGPAARPEGK